MKLNFAVLCILPLAGCATIVNGSTETVAVQTTAGAAAVVSAECALSNNKGTWTVTTPGAVIVHRGGEPLGINCTKPGYAPATATVAATTSGYVYGNILIGGGLGATMDTVNGAAWDYPKTITIPMQPTPSLAASTN